YIDLLFFFSTDHHNRLFRKVHNPRLLLHTTLTPSTKQPHKRPMDYVSTLLYQFRLTRCSGPPFPSKQTRRWTHPPSSSCHMDDALGQSRIGHLLAHRQTDVCLFYRS